MDERAGMGKRKEGRQGPRDALPGQPGRSARGGRGDNVKGSLSCRVCSFM